MTLRRASANPGKAFWGGMTATDERGEFAFPDAEIGSYLISFAPLTQRIHPLRNTPTPIVSSTNLRFVPVFNQPVEIVPGSEGRWTLQQLLDPRVVLRDPTGTLVTRGAFSVLLTGAAPAAPGEAARDEAGLALNLLRPRLQRIPIGPDGVAVLRDMQPGRYSARGVVPDVGFIETGPFDIGAENAPALQWKLSPGAKLKLTARNAAGKALGGITVMLTQPSGEATAGITIVDNSPLSRAASADPSLATPGFVTKDGDGTFEADGLPPGSYTVAAAWQGGVSQTVRVQLSQDKASEISVILAPRTVTSVALKVVDGQGKPRANQEMVFQLTPENAVEPRVAARRIMTRYARTDAEGIATLFPIRRGRLKVAGRLASKAGNTFSANPVLVAAEGNNAAATVTVP